MHTLASIILVFGVVVLGLFPAGCRRASTSSLPAPALQEVYSFVDGPLTEIPPGVHSPELYVQQYGMMTALPVEERLFLARTVFSSDQGAGVELGWWDGSNGNYTRLAPNQPIAKQFGWPEMPLPGTDFDFGKVTHANQLKFFNHGLTVTLFIGENRKEVYPRIIQGESPDFRRWTHLDRRLLAEADPGSEPAAAEVGQMLLAWVKKNEVHFQYGDMDRPKSHRIGHSIGSFNQLKVFGDKTGLWGGIVFASPEGLEVRTLKLDQPFNSPGSYEIGRHLLAPAPDTYNPNNLQRLPHLRPGLGEREVKSAFAGAAAGDRGWVFWSEKHRLIENGRLMSERMILMQAQTGDRGKTWWTSQLTEVPHGDYHNVYALPTNGRLIVIWGNQYLAIDPKSGQATLPGSLPTRDVLFIPDAVDHNGETLLLLWPSIYRIG